MSNALWMRGEFDFIVIPSRVRLLSSLRECIVASCSSGVVVNDECPNVERSTVVAVIAGEARARHGLALTDRY
jgi:hypothetical protein